MQEGAAARNYLAKRREPETGLANHDVEPNTRDKSHGSEVFPSDPELSRLIDAYMREKRLPYNVAAAFARAGVEPPHRDAIDARGFTFAERAILDREAA